jgi:hypothetical protein
MHYSGHFDWRLGQMTRDDLEVVNEGLEAQARHIAWLARAHKDSRRLAKRNDWGRESVRYFDGVVSGTLTALKMTNNDRRQVRDVIRKQDARAHARGLIQSELARQEQEGKLSIAEQVDYDLLMGIDLDRIN